MAINTPQPSTKQVLTPQDKLAALALRRSYAEAQETMQLKIEVGSLKHEVDLLKCTIEQMRAELLDLRYPKRHYTNYIPVITPAQSPRVTRPLGDIDQWSTISEMPSVKTPAVAQEHFIIEMGLPEQIVEATEGHYKLYNRSANVCYLNTKNLATLAQDYSILDIIWGPHLIELRRDDSLTDDQILCVTEETSDVEATQKRAAYKPVDSRSAVPSGPSLT